MIGPSIPAHLSKQSDNEDGAPEPSTLESIGPQLPSSTSQDDHEEGEDEDAWMPALPPDLEPAPVRVIGPSISTSIPPPLSVQEPDDLDDDYGPMPLPAGSHAGDDAHSGVREFIEREERRKKELEESLKPKALKRDEWMLAPPKDSGILGSLDPTKLKARQFSRNTEEKSTISTLWTETPAERQARLADETMGKRKRAEISAGAMPVEEETDEDRKRRRRDIEISRTLEERNKMERGTSLLDLHIPKDSTSTSTSSRDLMTKSQAIWDRDRDMSLGGRLMDDGARHKLIKDAKGLGGRFSSSSKGGRFL